MFGKSVAQRQAEAARPFRVGDRVRVIDPAKFGLGPHTSEGVLEDCGAFFGTLVCERFSRPSRKDGTTVPQIRSRQRFRLSDLEKV